MSIRSKTTCKFTSIVYITIHNYICDNYSEIFNFCTNMIIMRFSLSLIQSFVVELYNQECQEVKI